MRQRRHVRHGTKHQLERRVRNRSHEGGIIRRITLGSFFFVSPTDPSRQRAQHDDARVLRLTATHRDHILQRQRLTRQPLGRASLGRRTHVDADDDVAVGDGDERASWADQFGAELKTLLREPSTGGVLVQLPRHRLHAVER